MTAHALRDWCRFSLTGSVFIEPGSPWQNPFVESFGSRIRDELLAVEQFSCLAEAQVMVEDWRQDYNHHRPHSALGMMAPARFAAAWREAAAAGKLIPLAPPSASPDAHQGPAEAAPVASLRSPLRGFAPRGDGTTLHHDTHPPLSQQVDR